MAVSRATESGHFATGGRATESRFPKKSTSVLVGWTGGVAVNHFFRMK